MKKRPCLVVFLVLAAQLPLWGYDSSPFSVQIVPEAIWAAATGGGTWVTEIQVTNLGAEVPYLNAAFSCAGGTSGQFPIAIALAQNKSIRFSNILSTLDALDSSGFVYYGQVGVLSISSSDIGSRIQVQAKTVNGNFGKTFPGLNPIEGNSAAKDRPMIIQDLVQNATYRTFVGAFNGNLSLVFVRFRIVDGDGAQVGSVVEKAIPVMSFVSFNPFKEAGFATGT
ncbi:MAG: hypothetical protein OEW05_07325, partial [Candidatus Aminicenantes bacterium]|nr:hypothetical protein [Candidatus Aminicenantes bacterium]